nr:hypothetical protein [Tanacetum cinerariifolium]
MLSNPSQPSVFIRMDTGMHKEDQQATGGPTSLEVISEAIANPQLSIDLHILADQTKFVSEGLEIVLTQPGIGKRASSIARQVMEEEISSTIKLEDLAKLVSNVQPSFKDMDSPKDDSIIVVDDNDEDEEADEVHATPNIEIKDTLVHKSSSPRSSQIQELTNQGKLKTLDALPSLLNKATNALNWFSQVIALNKTRDTIIPSPGQVSTQPAEGEKNTNRATISQGDIKKEKGKKAMFSKDVEEVSTKSDSDDETICVPGYMVESSKKRDMKKFNFVTKDGEIVHLTEEQISAQKKIEEEAKAEATRCEGEKRKEELIDLLGREMVNKYYNNKLQYDRYCDKMLNRRAKLRITNGDILTRKGPITLKVYREEDISEIIFEFKASDLHLGE